jgi:hypothetical protein
MFIQIIKIIFVMFSISYRPFNIPVHQLLAF